MNPDGVANFAPMLVNLRLFYVEAFQTCVKFHDILRRIRTNMDEAQGMDVFTQKVLLGLA